MYENNHSSHSLHLGSMLVGIAAGVAGTIIYATYREREFNRIVEKTRELSDKGVDYVGNVGDTIKDKAVAVMDSAETAVGHLGESVRKITNREANAIASATSK